MDASPLVYQKLYDDEERVWGRGLDSVGLTYERSEPLGSINGWGFLDKLSDKQPLEKASAPWSQLYRQHRTEERARVLRNSVCYRFHPNGNSNCNASSRQCCNILLHTACFLLISSAILRSTNVTDRVIARLDAGLSPGQFLRNM
jgi:hypothetical protein